MLLHNFSYQSGNIKKPCSKHWGKWNNFLKTHVKD